ncbi:cuticle protein [Holotrichia oblita]|uniref:Cuticle protein n=1 Tax=Holotrichia oblita TaxID=644536 RepID=A0ACB9TEP6_HOLOL|nr:cuticle protein [Holotrichia oblita]
MKVVIVFAAFVAVAFGASVTGDKDAAVVRSELNNIGVDGYNYAYETSNGISAEEQGQLQNVGTDNEAIQVRGQFTYVGSDGNTYAVTYTADENGFKPQGAHLPQQ